MGYIKWIAYIKSEFKILLNSCLISKHLSYLCRHAVIRKVIRDEQLTLKCCFWYEQWKKMAMDLMSCCLLLRKSKETIIGTLEFIYLLTCVQWLYYIIYSYIKRICPLYLKTCKQYIFLFTDKLKFITCSNVIHSKILKSSLSKFNLHRPSPILETLVY